MAKKAAPLKVMHVISGDLWAGAEVQACTLLKHLRGRCDISVIVLNPGRLAEELRELGIPLAILDEGELNSLQLVGKMRKAFLAFKPDIVHTHRQKENILGSLANTLSVRATCVRTSHGAPEFKPRGVRKIQAALDWVIGRYLQAAIIAVSDDLAVKLSSRFPQAKIKVIHNGVDVEALEEKVAKADFCLKYPGAKHVGIVGRIEPVKRVDLFIEMAGILKGALPEQELQFHIIGDGTLRPQMEAQVRESGMEGVVHFNGHREDIPSCLASLDLLIMCSDHEGTPMTALEAIALSTPLVAHHVGGLKEVLDGSPDFQVTQHTAEGYAAVVAPLLRNESAPRLRLAQRYFAKKNAEQTALLYSQLARKGRLLDAGS